MSDSLYLITAGKASPLLEKMTFAVTNSFESITKITNSEELPNLINKKILFSVQLNQAGFCPEMDHLLSSLWDRGEASLSGSTAIVLIHCESELFTKTYCQNLIFHANMLGCSFMGRPYVEAAGNLYNFSVAQKTIHKPLMDVCLTLCADLGVRFKNFDPQFIKNAKICVLHSSNFETSNTLMLWNLVYQHLQSLDIKVHHIENGTVKDCIGCPYKTCKHYGQHQTCFYGGFMVEEIYPSILASDALILLCPNYNDGLSANISAVINRLTALFRKTKFYSKSVFGIIVSGNSGSDALGKQLISALNMNKTFRLPPYFSLCANANDAGAILNVPGIEEKAKAFAENIKREIKKDN